MKKIVRILTILSVLMISQWQVQAQRPHPGPPHRGPQLEKLSGELQITDEQKTALQALRENYIAEIKALRDQDFESPEDRRAAMQEIRTAQEEDVQAILTEAQIEKLAELKKEGFAKRKENRKAHMEKRKAMAAEMQTYKENNIMPVLREQRAKLEQKISAEDKATIAAIRANKPDRPKSMEDRMDKKDRPHRAELTEAQKEARRSEREQIKALVEKYDSDITSLLAEVETKQEEWKEDMQKIHEEHAPKDVDEAPRRGRRGGMKGERMKGEKGAEKPSEGMRRHGHHSPRHKKEMGKVAFLLLDPTEATTPATTRADFADLQVFPNPSASRNTLTYTLKDAGYYRVELRDKDGLVLQVISNEYRQAGDYREEIDMSNRVAGTYYLSIVGAEGVVSKKVVVVK